MSKSNFVPPKLKDKNKWSINFHNFIKHTLIKNPKRRPSATKLIHVSSLIKTETMKKSIIIISQEISREWDLKKKNYLELYVAQD